MGLAVGDALGAPLEFQPPGSFEPITDMIGGGRFQLQPGQWTDDTSLALCLAESLIEKNGSDPVDQVERYLRWWREGHLSSTGRCIGIGHSVSSALFKFIRTREPFCGSTLAHTAGNGSLMRLAPVPLFYYENQQQAIEQAAISSLTTHAVPACVDACRYFAGLIVGALQGESKEVLLGERYCPIVNYWDQNPLVPEIDEVACGSFKRREPPDIQGAGYVVQSLEAALWALYQGDNFREACLLAANLGDDADTTAAITCQLAGAYYGYEAIGRPWLLKLSHHDMILSYADQIFSCRPIS